MGLSLCWLVWFCIGQLGIVETSVYILGCNSSSHTLQRFRPQIQMEQQQQPVSHLAFLVWKLKRSPRALIDALSLLRSDLPCDVRPQQTQSINEGARRALQFPNDPC